MASIKVSYENGNLTLSDHGVTDASRSEQIIWTVDGKVKKITNVVAKSTSPISTNNFWSESPHQTGVNFMGTINGTVEGAWDYDISADVNTDNGTENKTLDPRIQVLSK